MMDSAATQYLASKEINKKILCQFVFDTSASMAGKPLADLKQGIAQFISLSKNNSHIHKTFELGMIVAAGRVHEIQPLIEIEKVTHPALFACGGAPLGQAMALAQHRLYLRKHQLLRKGVTSVASHLILISDGMPTDNWLTVAAQLKQQAELGNISVLAVGLPGSNLHMLSQFSQHPAKSIAFSELTAFFHWLAILLTQKIK